ncbi:MULTISPECIES: Eco57I restriction-modification methylase domain-containing protein [Vibrio harveyi group]|uniref:Eco57I restriction-modification methylase domain-containing protein n=1 Tax=Vibrio harveyi group TaxID=717610 RepID=UPI0015F70E16|nr:MULTISPECIES: N-6 DNA methylase [Vibrio harveyi group]MDF5048290.1 Eco57I restriction-modification methylase domain-containing protein [Vibrio parahaemolyticus]MDF5621945.1 Eco57I restriction-modification methylase domain-containing protein [Vibrio parahaemolyticus]UPR11672.1 Eco57I restriction-modification methylase domain-containing protein [Vibrio parahaemolyticus]HCD5200358.1 Eco57I restriction-modification methylase domain-containing protein [Vibrio parahaemolyticus]
MDQLQELITRFKSNINTHLSSSYNETQTRTDFITPLLNFLGWDVGNTEKLPSDYREVIEEARLRSPAQETKRPDYELRVARIRKLFIEAKKPSVNIDIDEKSAFQARRYGYSAGLPVTVLTNFRQIAIYDTTIPPKKEDEAYVARIEFIELDELVDKISILEKYVSRKSVSQPSYLSNIIKKKKSKQEKSFDEHFLEKIKSWRLEIANDLYSKDSSLNAKELTNFTQQIISRLIFLRICEDRNLEEYEHLLSCSRSGFSEIMNLIKHSDKKYNSGLFDIFNDNKDTYLISDKVIKGIISQLYYPNSPYSFSVLETEILGGIYDQFLCEELSYEKNKIVSKFKPEYRDAGGVVTTPRHIVDHIVNESISKPFSKLSLHEIESKTILDTCCGSGVFLISAFEALIEIYCKKYIKDAHNHLGKNIIKVNDNNYQLTLSAKSRILKNNIFGVDIDPESIELAKLGLYLKLIEGEEKLTGNNILPDLDNNLKCGNSIISHHEWEKHKDSDNYFEALNLFDWNTEFKAILSQGGFDIIIGNPPYVRIQKLKKYSIDELDYYQSGDSPYYTAKRKDIDKYFIFIEKSTKLINKNGTVSLIIPNKFIANQYGELLREYIHNNNLLKKVTNFGSIHVFKGKALNYTCILELSHNTTGHVDCEKVSDINDWIQNKNSRINTYPISTFKSKPWIFPEENISKILQQCEAKSSLSLGDISDIYVGLQTSADDVYVIKEKFSDEKFVYFEKDNQKFQVEKSILKPFILDVQLEAFRQATPNSWLIYPYYDKNNKISLYSEEEMSNLFPYTYKYLKNYRERLSNRSITGGKKEERTWYQYGRSQSLNKMEQSKIILPVQSKNYKYTPDYSHLYLTGGGNGPYYIIKPTSKNYSIQVLLAILNHEISEAQVRLCTSIIGNGYYAHNKEFITNLLIPDLTNDEKVYIEGLVNSILETERNIPKLKQHQKISSQRKADALKEKLRDTVTDVFGISKADCELLSKVSPE